MRSNKKKSATPTMTPGISRKLAADRYWKLQAMAQKFGNARMSVTSAEQGLQTARANVDAALQALRAELKAAGLNPDAHYAMKDDELLVIEMKPK